METLSILQMVNQGALATYPLIAFSVLTISIVFERLWALRNLVSQTLHLSSGICPILEKGQMSEALQTARNQVTTPAGRIFTDVLARHSSDSLEYLSDLTEEKRFEEVEALKGPLWVLGTAGASAPFIGLFGTVVGIMLTFQRISVQGSTNLTVVGPGISEALIATAAGLFAAIPAVYFYNHLTHRVKELSSVMDDFSLEFLNIAERNFT